MLLLSFVTLLASSLVVAASPGLLSGLSSRALVATDNVVTWLSPNSKTVVAQCYPLNITFQTDRMPCGLYIGYSINQKVGYDELETWRNDSSNPWESRYDVISYNLTAVAVSAGSVIWFEVWSWDNTESFLAGSGVTVQPSDDSSCISEIISADSTYNETMSGSGVTTTFSGLLSTATESALTHPSSNTAAIVGGVIGGLAAMGLAGLTAFYIVRRRRRTNKSGVAAFEVDGREFEPGPSSDAGSPGAAMISPFGAPNFSRPLSVSTYSSPGVSISQSTRLLTLPEDVIQERDGGFVEGYQVERVPPTYTDATDAPFSLGNNSTTGSTLSQK